MFFKIVFICCVYSTLASCYALNFDDNTTFNPFGDGDSKVITASNLNSLGTFIVCYSDGTAEEYTQGLQFIRSIQNLSLTSPVVQIKVFSYPSVFLTLNGAPFNSNNTVIGALDSTRKQIKMIDYYSMAVVVEHQASNVTHILCYFLVPLTTYTSTTNLNLVTNNIIMIVDSFGGTVYRQTTTQLDVINISDGIQNSSIESVSLMNTNNQIMVNYKILFGTLPTIFMISGSIKIRLNPSGIVLTNSGFGFDTILRPNSPFNFSFFQSFDSLGYFQELSGNIIIIDVLRITVVSQIDPILNQSRALQVFSYGGSTYILFVDRIIEISYDPVSSSITAISSGTLPSSKVRTVVSQTTQLFNYDGMATYRIGNCLDFHCISCRTNTSVCSSCLNQFVLENGSCIKIIVPVLSPQGVFTHYDGTIQSALVCGGTSNSSQRNMCENIANSSSIQEGVYINKMLLSVPFISQIIIFADPFFQFTNDYWYYLYHNRNYSELVWTNLFFGMLTFINNGKMAPGFIDKDAINAIYDNKCKQIFTSNYSNYTNPNVLQIDGSESYFIKVMRDVFLWKYSFILLVFVLSRIAMTIYNYKSGKIMFVLQKVDRKNQKRLRLNSQAKQKFTLPQKLKRNFCQQRGRTILNFIKESSLIKALLIQLIEDNLIFFTFYCGLQLRMNSFFNFYDKINLILTLAILFLCISFSFCFYFFIFSNYPAESGRFIENRFNKIEAYQIKTIEIVTKGAFYGFVQGYFVADYTVLMILLIILKSVTVVILFVQRALFKKKSLWFLYFSYVCFGLLYDIFLLVTSTLDINSLSNFLIVSLSNIEVFLIAGFVFSIILQMIVVIFYGLRRILREIYQRIRKYSFQKERRDSLEAKNTSEPAKIENLVKKPQRHIFWK